MKPNACIVYISSRQYCITHSLGSLWNSYNHKHNYPVYVFYFDDIYDSEELRKSITNATPQDVKFISVPYSTPSHVAESELYYNRKNLWYVNSSFPKSRKGYLHMCNFTSNMYGYENTELHKYDYVITHDDESGYDKDMLVDPVSQLEDMDYFMGAFFVGQRLKSGAPHQGHFDTRVGLWDFTKKFIIDNNITPRSSMLKNLLTDEKSDYNFHMLEWCDTYVIKTKMFELELWKKWISAVNESGGIYKYRWGDNEIISLFCHMVQEEIYNFNLVNTGFHNQGKFRILQDIAPGVKDLNR